MTWQWGDVTNIVFHVKHTYIAIDSIPLVSAPKGCSKKTEVIPLLLQDSCITQTNFLQG